MSRVFGWCHAHSSPLPTWRKGHPQTVAVWNGSHCRVCSIVDAANHAAYDVYFWQRPVHDPQFEGDEGPAIFDSDAFERSQLARERWFARESEANATTPTQATSTWLPRVWVEGHRDLRAHWIGMEEVGGPAARYWESTSNLRDVAWFRRSDEPERAAEGSDLAAFLRGPT